MSVTPRRPPSPIIALLPFIDACPFAEAPHRAEALAHEFETTGIKCELVERAEWRCSANPDERKVELDLFTIEEIWAMAHAFVSIDLHVEKVVRESPQRLREPLRMNLFGPELLPAGQMLAWAFNRWRANRHDPWTQGMPLPSLFGIGLLERTGTMQEDHATRACLAATAFVVHHELAHLRLRHAAGIVLPEQELEADAEAARWLLDGGPRELRAAILGGIAIALLVLAFREAFIPTAPSHPPATLRLTAALDPYLADHENDRIWLFVANGLLASLDISRGPGQADIRPTTMRDIVDQLIDQLTRHPTTPTRPTIP